MRRFILWLAAFSLFANVQALTIHIDYTYDASGFFAVHDPLNPDASTLAHATVEKAAQDLGNALAAEANASLNAVTTNDFVSGNQLADISWELSFRDPSTVPPSDPNDLSNQVTVTDFTNDLFDTLDAFTVYAGASTLVGSTELGEGAPVSAQPTLAYGGAGTEQQNVDGIHDAIALSNGFMSRGSGPTIYTIHPDPVDVGSTHIDYTLDVGPVAGFLSVTSGTAWHLDYHTLPGAGEYDLYTVVLHEMMHALGFGTSKMWATFRAVNNTDWTGANVIALRGNGVGVLDGATNSAHIAGTEMWPTIATTAGVPAGTMQNAVMDPTLATGVRRTLTQLDIAFLKDLGFGPAVASPTPSTTPIPAATATPTPVPTPPASPKLIGSPKIITTKSKITLSGILVSPGSYVVYKIGKGPFLKAKGAEAWKIAIKLKPGKTIVTIASFDPVSGLTSGEKKITITKK